ncbi:P-loop containing nucleoside triphosphate hydrolase protein [Echria macrotheca]|uniref:P-loop containing nucleoside triphosphate hydrolase protein n=1 Tax=Echria macrotheca TaxID=438768 RepID=A0AAJ0FBI0_9PEZI|nr:P-loop containing nucleoside triphosphate hydrolase protein [Echria macrotheca]
MDDRKAIIVGISGCSSSGKTTLARLLRDIFPNTFILHEDDFYKPEDQLPIRHGLVDWDCAEALSIPDMERALSHIRTTGTFPPTLLSKEDQNSVGASPITETHLQSAKTRVTNWLSPPNPGSLIFSSSSSSPPKICLLDGFLLYHPPTFRHIMSALDIKLFLRVSRSKATQRREARDGYVTLEGFWQDPPGYVDKIVWPNYAASHAWLFEGGDVERGVLDQSVLEREGILVAGMGREERQKIDPDFGETLDWAVGTVMAELERIVLGKKGEGA